MKVVHIISGLTQGGAESALFRLLTYSPSPDIKHIIISLTGTDVYGSRFEAEGIQVFALAMPRRRVTLKGLLRLWNILRGEKPDVVQTWMYHSDLIGGIVARLAGVKRITWGVVHFNLGKDVTPLSTRIVAKLCALVSGFIPHIIISCSEKAIGVHRRIGYSNKFRYIPLGFDMNELVLNPASRETVRKKWQFTGQEVVIGCVARWDPQKDHKNLVRAFASITNQYPGVKCVLIGPGMNFENEELVQMIHEEYGKGDDLILSGVADSIPSAMNALDLHILPSLGEAFPNVVAEAMGCGTPCVVTDVGDASIIVDKTGWVVPPGNSMALASAIETALELQKDNADWQLRKQACRERVIRSYSIEKMIENYINAWRN
jgi:glycosyltransferase involved in cell wall biosynthesis